MVGLLVLSRAAAAVSHPCYQGNYGAYEQFEPSQGAYNGVRAYADFEAAVIASDGSQLIAHPMQMVTSQLDFVGWGTRRGNAVQDPNPLPNCAVDTSAHWKLYVDGSKNSQYFCQDIAGTISGTDTGRLFNLNWGDCNGTNKFRAYLDGTRKWCDTIGSSFITYISIGAEAGDINQPPINLNTLHIDIHYYDIDKKLDSNDTWYPWSNNAYYCVDSGYAYLHPTYDDFTPYE